VGKCYIHKIFAEKIGEKVTDIDSKLSYLGKTYYQEERQFFAQN
jgi:hypothetical protein